MKLWKTFERVPKLSCWDKSLKRQSFEVQLSLWEFSFQDSFVLLINFLKMWRCWGFHKFCRLLQMSWDMCSGLLKNSILYIEWSVQIQIQFLHATLWGLFNFGHHQVYQQILQADFSQSVKINWNFIYFTISISGYISRRNDPENPETLTDCYRASGCLLGECSFSRFWWINRNSRQWVSWAIWYQVRLTTSF